ncbi:MAG TPA: PIN domain-containing protein [Saprospiraceae bacterium]|jgi:predicted nucleic acid-binding protein|nr:PIN domain-containing protein [Saprospiraceae bacterium]HRN33711.1 PIN domain-containing protein [Saprospiraceae bacterium]HRP84002.1 PIN domain-containing protein [Saprospiraceae bacterium]
MSVLVDTSVWIGYFSKGEYIQLERLIKEDLVVTNDLILAELLPFMHKAGAFKAIHALEAIEKKELQIHWPSIIEMQKLNLSNGYIGIGIPDLIICQHCIQHDYWLWTNDKHFTFMKEYTELKLYADQ